jgi:hypothetical protein
MACYTKNVSRREKKSKAWAKETRRRLDAIWKRVGGNLRSALESEFFPGPNFFCFSV